MSFPVPDTPFPPGVGAWRGILCVPDSSRRNLCKTRGVGRRGPLVLLRGYHLSCLQWSPGGVLGVGIRVRVFP